MWPGSHVTESRTVWKDLGSRRIRKSLEGVRVRDDVKGHGFLMVYTWCTHVQRRLKVWRQGTCKKHGGLKENTCGWVREHEDDTWTLGQE